MNCVIAEVFRKNKAGASIRNLSAVVMPLMTDFFSAVAIKKALTGVRAFFGQLIIKK